MASASTETGTKTTVTSKAQQKESLLFVLRADTAVIAKDDSGYTLTLEGMDNKVLYFADRPVRLAGFITMDTLMNDWAKGANSFQDNPPNAAFVHGNLKTNDKGMAAATPLELMNPVATEKGWMFHLKKLDGTISMGTYNRVTVFIDNFIRWHGGLGGRIIPGDFEGARLGGN
jgi:hypothetical protein